MEESRLNGEWTRKGNLALREEKFQGNSGDDYGTLSSAETSLHPKNTEPDCRKCGMKEETAHHIV